MTGEQKLEWDANTMYSLYMYITPPLPACIVYMTVGSDNREYTDRVLAPHSCFCSFFTSHPYILSAKCFHLLVGYGDDW